MCVCFFSEFYRSPSWPTPRISNLDLIASIPPIITSPSSLWTLTPLSTRTNRTRFWSFHSSPLRLRKPLPISPQLQSHHSPPPPLLQQRQLQQPQQSSQPQTPIQSGTSRCATTPMNLPLSKCSSTNSFRFPPWSGPSPRAVSSPGLLPVTPDSPGPR